MQKIPRGVWILGFVSLFMDVSSEMIHALLPLYLVGALGVSALILGVIEGVAEATAQIVKVFSGLISDRIGNRKMLALLGYGLAALVKPVFPLAESAFAVVAARVLDRVGKGIRGAPRDALVADLTPKELRGAAYGLRQSLDTIGAFLGPLLAVGLMLAYADDVRAVLWFACIPAAIAVAILAFGISEPQHKVKAGQQRPGVNFATARLLGRAFWIVTLTGAVLMLARFSEAFLILKVAEVGLQVSYIPLVLVVMSLAYSLSAYPAGVLSDKAGTRGMLLTGFAVLLVADVILAFATSIPMAMAGIALWGLHMGLTQGLLSAMVANAAPAKLRGTAFGVFSMVSGVVMLMASVLAGYLWDSLGSSATFLAGALFTGLGFIMLAMQKRQAG
jgi:MFS family permease